MDDVVRQLIGDGCHHHGMDLVRQDRSVGGKVTVQFAVGRKQMVCYRCHDGRLALTSICVGASVAQRNPARFARELLARNRHTELVGFRFRPNGSIEAFVDHPTTTLTRQELLFTLVHLAREADRMEWIWTGRDVL